MSDKDLLDQIEALGADTVYFIKGGDGLWGAHVRYPGAGPLSYAVVRCKKLRDSIEGVLYPPDPEIEDLL